MATMVPDPLIPATCWTAPEIPQAIYNLGVTVEPVCPTCLDWGIQPESTAALEQPTVPPKRPASSLSISKFSGFFMPRPPDTTTSASPTGMVPSSQAFIKSTTWVRMSFAWMSSRMTAAWFPSTGAGFLNAPGLTVPIWGRVSLQRICAYRLPPKAGRSHTTLPVSSTLSAVQSAVRPV